MSEKEQTIKDCINIVRVFCSEELRRSTILPQMEGSRRGDFITVFESDLINQFKNLLK